VFIDARFLSGSNGNREPILLLEIKCFPDENSTTNDLYTAIGQYQIYRAMLVETQQPGSVYLAVPQPIFDKIFDAAVMRVIQESHIKYALVDLEREEIVRWSK
jgi:hypothetical protein